MRRHWPFAFLLLFALILTIHVVPPPRNANRSPEPTKSLGSDGGLLATLGPASIPPLPGLAALATPCRAPRPEVAGLLWMLRQQNEDGSWGDVATTLGDRTIGKTGVTSLVLVALLDAGYSHLSRDEYDGLAVGPIVKKALTWLISQQREDGSFDSGFDDCFDHALAALALGEGYGMTASKLLRDPTTRALEALLRIQGADGSWGGTTVTPWAIQALAAGEDCDLPLLKPASDRALGYLAADSPLTLLEARMLGRDHRDPEEADRLARAIADSPPRPGETDFDAIFHEALGLYLYDGASGVLWKAWAPAAREALVATQNADGSWNGGSLSHRLVRASLAGMSFQIYSRATSAFALER